MIVGGLDLGTTGCKIALYDETAANIATYYSEYPAYHSDGRHEIDFADIRTGIFSILKQATEKYEISAIAVTSFGETFAMLDGNDNILTRSILYTDPRGTEECERIKERFGTEYLTLINGTQPHPMYSLYKMLWWKKNDPETFSKCRRILLGEDFAVYLLTGNPQIDYSLASRTGAFDIEKKCWIEEIFQYCGIDSDLLSKPVPIGTAAGKLKESLKKELGIKNDITVVNGCQDQIAAMIGSGIFDTESVMDGIGTVECIPVMLKEKPEDLNFYKGGYPLVPYLDGAYACYAFSFAGGGSLKWFRNTFAELERREAEAEGKNVYAELDKKVGDDPTGILVLPHFSGAATPYMDNGSKAAFVGITMETTKTDIYKALMEGTSYEMLLNFNTLKEFTGEIKEIRATGGGAASEVWLQIKADIYGTNITALDCREVGAAGAAALAGCAVGVFTDLKSVVSKMVPAGKIYRPDMEKHKEYAVIYKKYEKLYKAVRALI